MAEGRIFINYRRDDSRADSGRLYDRLSARFPGKVFRDVASLEPGVEWHDAINRVLGQADACIVVIGSNWLNIKDGSGRRRLEDPNDTVRQEVVTALARQMRVFPVLVGGAKMPDVADVPFDLQSLCRRNALELTEQDWDEDVAKLIKALEIAIGPQQAPTPPPVDRGSAFKKWGLGAMVAVAALVLLVAYMGKPNPPGPNPVPPNPKPSPLVVDPPDVNPAPPDEVPAEPKRRHTAVGAHLIGNWNAVFTGNGQQANELVEFYGDNSFRFMLRGGVVAVGKWRYNPGAESLDLANSTNLVNRVKFTCAWKDTGTEQFAGSCLDRMQVAWTVSLTNKVGDVPEAPYPVPRVNMSNLTMAERAAFVQLLAAQHCTCTCRMTVLVCLEKDQTCQYSPNLAQTALTNFLRITRG